MCRPWQVEFLVQLMPRSTSEELQRDYEFIMTVNSTNPESRHTRTNNDVTLQLPIGIHTELLLLGSVASYRCHID